MNTLTLHILSQQALISYISPNHIYVLEYVAQGRIEQISKKYQNTDITIRRALIAKRTTGRVKVSARLSKNFDRRNPTSSQAQGRCHFFFPPRPSAAFFASAIGEKTSALASDHHLQSWWWEEQRIIKRKATQQSGSVGSLFCNARQGSRGRAGQQRTS